MVRIIQERYLSDRNLDRLREAISQQQQTQALPQHEPHDEEGIKRRIAETEEAISVLRDLRGALEKAEPADSRELLGSVVSRIDLFFDRHKCRKYTRTTFREGLIHLRPDAVFTSLSTPSHPSDLQLR